jgi:hypothetical protein
MRFTLACSLLLSIACGGSQKPAATESSDTSSLEQGSSASSSPASTAATPTTDTAASAPAPTASATAATDSAPPASTHPVPGATGSIDGKPFSPRLAQVAGPLQKDGRLPIIIHEGTDCVAAGDAKPGDGAIRLLVTWSDGYKIDLSALRRGKKGNPGEAAFMRVGADRKAQISSTFKPTGRLTIVSAPMQKDAIGKLAVDLQSGDYMVAGDLDVKVCVAPK